MSYEMLGARPEMMLDEPGYRFSVWAPHAQNVSVVGDFNCWDNQINPMQRHGSTGIWTVFIPDVRQWDRYKYAIQFSTGEWQLKADPFARHAETRPSTASILYDPSDYEWQDADYLADLPDAYTVKPLNIYEVHLGSWRRYSDGSCYNYRDIAPQLADYVVEMGYNAVELMPVMEHPLDDSWGYQVTGYFAPTSRYGTPADLKFLVDCLHQHGIRVILDWVPAHFPRDAFGLAKFDGTALYEYADTRLAEHEDWGTLVFDYSKAEVRSFLLSSAYFWLKEFHFDGLRVDAVTSMIYLGFGRKEHLTNAHGGTENLEAISFLRELNALIREKLPHCLMIAEESTEFPELTKGSDLGGIGFTHKWNMGWMNDTLDYFSFDYYLRKQHHQLLTFSMMYAFSERFILPFSHDEVVHGKKTLLGRMAGDYWRQFASLRTLFMYQMAHPGAKLTFMGNEFAPYLEWRYYEELEWFMLQYPAHEAMHRFVKQLNHLYLAEKALWQIDDSWAGYEWLKNDDLENSVIAFARKGENPDDLVVAIFNLTPKVFDYYELQAPRAGEYEIICNSDDKTWGGAGYWYDTEEKKPKVLKTVDEIIEQENKGTDQIADKIELKQSQRDVRGIETDQMLATEIQVSSKFELTLPPLCGIYLKWQKPKS